MKTFAEEKMIRRFLKIMSMALVCSALLPLGVQAGGAGTTGGASFNKSYSPRAESLGGAYAAWADDAYALDYNPAGLSRLLRPEFAAAYNTGLVDDGLGYLGGGWTLGEQWTLGGGFAYYQAGKFDYLDASGQNAQTLNAQTDLVLQLGGAYQWWDELAVGGAAKLLFSTLLEEYHAQAFALDLGAMYKPQWEMIQNRARFGLVVRNLGTPVKYLDQADPLLLQAKLGGLYEILRNDPEHKTPHEVTAGLELQADIEGQIGAVLSAEYIYQKMLAARAGYQLVSDVKGLTLGLGFETDLGGYALGLDYSFSLIQKFNSTHKLALTLGLGIDRGRLSDWDRDQRWKKNLAASAKRQKITEQQQKEEQAVVKEKQKVEAFPVATTEVLEVSLKNGQPYQLILNIGRNSGSRIRSGMTGYIYRILSGNKVLVGKCTLGEIYAMRSQAQVINKTGDINTQCVVEIKQ